MRSVVTDNNIRRAIPCKVSFQFVYDCDRFGVFQSVDLSEAAEIIDSDHVVLAVEFEQVYGYFFPLARAKLMQL